MSNHDSQSKNAKKERGLKQLPDGRWRYSWKFQGRHHRKIARTKTEARALLESIRTKIREGRYLDVKEVRARSPFTAAIAIFLAYSKSHLRPTTGHDDVRFARLWQESKFFRGKMLDEITHEHIARYQQQRASEPSRSRRTKLGQQISKRAVDAEIARLKRLFSLAKKSGLCSHNPAAEIELFREEDKRVRYLLTEEEHRLLPFLSPWLSRVVRFDLHTGLRKGELLNLRWSWVDMGRKVVTIPASVAKGKCVRHIPLNQTAHDVLEDIRRAGVGTDANAYVFANERGERRVSFHKEWGRALKAAGITNFRFHDLRHTYASRLAMNGRPLTEIMQLMGHQSYELTLRYAHLSPTSLQEAVETLDRPARRKGVELSGSDGDDLQ